MVVDLHPHERIPSPPPPHTVRMHRQRKWYCFKFNHKISISKHCVLFACGKRTVLVTVGFPPTVPS